MRDGMPIDDAQFQTLLERVRELHQQAHAVTHSRSRFDANVRARLYWYPDAPALPQDQREIADEIIGLLADRRLSSAQSGQLEHAFFGQGRRRQPRKRRGFDILPAQYPE